MSDHSFPLSHRLLKSNEFDAVFEGQDYSIKNKSFLLIAKRNSLCFNRLGIIVGKKSLQRSIDRNRIKRQLRECFRTIEAMGLDIVIVVKPGIDFNCKTRGRILDCLCNLRQKVLA